MKGDSLFGVDSKRLKKLAALGLEQAESGRRDKGDAPVSNDVFVETSGDWVGHYKLLRILGEGGMGIVYLAQQHRPIRRQVALKLVKPGMDSKKIIARFTAEQQALACMDHPHVAHVYDAGLTAGGRPYFVMEYVEGIPITEHCDRHKLTIEARLELFLQVCEAIGHAHQKGLIHRDIKPSNILVSSKENQTLTKVIDFGIAKALTQGLAHSLTEQTLYTEQGQFVGTPEYMSPEQAEPTAQGVDTRTDIYSLGVVLYELLAGVLPFDTETFREGGAEHIRRVIREEDPKTPSTRLNRASGDTSTKAALLRCTDKRTLNRTLHGDLDWITLKAMDKDPDRRYATAQALTEDIRRYLRHEPVTAGSPTLVYRFRKFVRRHRHAVIAAACVVMVVLLGVLSAVLYRQNMAGRNRLVEARQASALQQAEAALVTAEVSYAEGNYEQAMAEVEVSLTRVPDQINANLLKAHILADTGKTDEAFTILQRLEVEFPNEGAVYEMLAMLYVAQGDDARVAHYRQLSEAFPPQTAEAYIIQAIAADSLEAVLSRLSEALKLDGQHYQALRMRARTYAALKDYDNMEHDAIRMTFLQPQNPFGHALRAVAQRHLDQYVKALANHDEAIELAGDTHPDLATFYDQRRETYFRLGQYEQALADASECIRRDPNDMRFQRGFLGALIGLGRYGQLDEQYEISDIDTMMGFPSWLSTYVAERMASGQAWAAPDNEDQGVTARLLRGIHRRLEELEDKAQRLVSHAAAADFSPDGHKLAYARFNPDVMWETQTVLTRAEQPGSKGIEIIDLETKAVRSLVSDGHYPRWSPDGQHIAFVKSAYFFRLPRAEHIHTVPAAGGDPNTLCPGVLLGWSKDSKSIYYYSAQDAFVYKRPFDDPNAAPERIIYSPTYFPSISPDESRIAYQHRGQLIIKDLGTLETVATWQLPILPIYFWASWRVPHRPNFEPIPIEWSPTGQELSLGSEWADFGLWIYDLRTQSAARVLRGAVLSARWSSDGRRMAIVTGNPGWEVWQAEIDPNKPTAESLGPGLAQRAHCQQTLDELEDDLAKFPPELHPWMRGRAQAFCAAGLGDPNGVMVGFNAWIQSLPEDKATLASTYWQMGNSLLDRYETQADDEAVLKLAEDMARLAPEPWSGQVFLGMAHYRVGDYEGALSALNQAEKQRVKSQGDRYAEPVSYTAMTLFQLGHQTEAIETLQTLRSLYQAQCGFDVFQMLVTAEKVFASGHADITALWDRLNEGNLDKALVLLDQIRNAPITPDIKATGTVSSAGQQLAIKFAWRAEQYNKRGQYVDALADFESAVRAAPQDETWQKKLVEFKQQRLDPD